MKTESRENCPSRKGTSEDSIEEQHNSLVDSSSESGQLSMPKWNIKLISYVEQLSECRFLLTHRVEVLV